MMDLFYSLRPKQWIKNLFLVLPLIFGKKLFMYPENLKVIEGLVLFSMFSSSVYLVNDIVDVDYDKCHRFKRLRPLASGRIRLRDARILSFSLAAISIYFSTWISSLFLAILIFYGSLNLIYTFFLKKIVILDVFCLGFFFLLRIIGGAILADVSLSHWIVFLTFLLALFLGFNKRRQELRASRSHASNQRDVLKKYNLPFIDQMVSVLTGSIVVVYILYVIDTRTIHEFGSDHLIFSIPFVYYGIFRYLYLVHKRQKGEDPTSLLLFDPMMQLNLIMWLLICIGVIYFKI